MKSLFDETKLKGVVLKNRGIRSATWDGMADRKGHPSPEHERMHEELAAGGIGLIITGTADVQGPALGMPGMLGIYDDEFIDDYARITSLVHRHDAPIVVQIGYQGSQSSLKTTGGRFWGLSAVKNRATGITPREMTRKDISVLIAWYAQAAERAKEAGFDGVQIHVAHGYFLNQTLSSYYNRRTDGYGGVVENRARVLYEVCEAVRESVGDDYFLMAKVNCEDFFEGGLTLGDSITVCQGLQEHGVDALEVSGGQAPQAGAEHCAIFIRTDLDRPEDQSYFCSQAAKIASEVDVPVALVGGNRDPESLENILQGTSIEYMSLCRPLICEPNLLNRWKSGDMEKAACTSCNWCLENARQGNDLACVLERNESRA